MIKSFEYHNEKTALLEELKSVAARAEISPFGRIAMGLSVLVHPLYYEGMTNTGQYSMLPFYNGKRSKVTDWLHRRGGGFYMIEETQKIVQSKTASIRFQLIEVYTAEQWGIAAAKHNTPYSVWEIVKAILAWQRVHVSGFYLHEHERPSKRGLCRKHNCPLKRGFETEREFWEYVRIPYINPAGRSEKEYQRWLEKVVQSGRDQPNRSNPS